MPHGWAGARSQIDLFRATKPALGQIRWQSPCPEEVHQTASDSRFFAWGIPTSQLRATRSKRHGPKAGGGKFRSSLPWMGLCRRLSLPSSRTGYTTEEFKPRPGRSSFLHAGFWSAWPSEPGGLGPPNGLRLREPELARIRGSCFSGPRLRRRGATRPLGAPAFSAECPIRAFQFPIRAGRSGICSCPSPKGSHPSRIDGGLIDTIAPN